MAAASPPMPAPGGPVRRRDLPVRMVELDWRSVAVMLAGFVGLIAVTGLARSAPRTITSVIVGSLLALALNPAVNAVQQRIGGRRVLAVSAVLTALALGFALLAFPFGPPGLPD